MSLFHKRRKIKNPELIERLRYRHVKYVSRRDETGAEYVLGKSGGINIKDEELIVFTEGKTVFRCSIYDLEAAELLSRDGVRLSYTDENGQEVAVVAHFA